MKSFLMRGDIPTKFLAVLGVILSCSYLMNAVPAFDDLYLPAKFSGFVEQYGFFKTIWIILSGMDMPHEYRTYGLSRLLQFFLWSVGGGPSFLFPLMIALSQLGSAIALLYLARERGMDEQMSLAVATLWLISPFSVNWCFHHYSYLVLPFQIVIVTCLVLSRITTVPYRYILAALLGFACALSGEMFLITGPLALLLVALASSDKSRLRLSFISIGAMIFTLIMHRWIWSELFQEVSGHQRYQLMTGIGTVKMMSITLIALESIPTSAWLQLREIALSGFGWGILIGGLAGLAYWWVTGRPSVVRGELQARSSISRGGLVSNLNVVLFFLGLALSSLSVYLALSILSDQVYEIMPRRYGYVSLTLLLLAFMIGIATLSDAVFGAKRLIMAIFVGLVASFAGQLQLGAIPAARAADSSLILLMKEAGGLDETHAKTTKGVLFFVSANAQYQLADANGATPGPKMDGAVGIELLESPFGAYWTAQFYSANMLGFRFAGIPKSNIEAGTVEVGGYGGRPYPNDLGKVRSEDVVVVANLGFDPQDPLGRNVRVFENFAEFQPYFFGRRIKRDVLELENNSLDEFVVDLGLIQQVPLNNPGVMPDKKFIESIGPINNTWISNYGLLEGQDSVYTHPNVSSALGYYRTNRNGVFTYGVTFKDVGMVEVGLDFWEQWGRQPGERVFELEVSWDGVVWASLGTIDIVSLNQNKPVSILLTKRNPEVFQFRMKPVAGSEDIPVIQGIRIRKLPSS